MGFLYETNINLSKLSRQPTLKRIVKEAWRGEVEEEINKWLAENPDAEFVNCEYQSCNGLGNLTILYKEPNEPPSQPQ
jgi:hypothetical protein